MKRVTVGFSGGIAVWMRLSDKAHDELRKAVRQRDGWYEVESEDGPITLDLGKVLFVKTEEEEHRVGFTGP